MASADNPVVLAYPEDSNTVHAVFLSSFLNIDDCAILRCNQRSLNNETKFKEHSDLQKALRQDKNMCKTCLRIMYSLWER